MKFHWTVKNNEHLGISMNYCQKNNIEEKKQVAKIEKERHKERNIYRNTYVLFF